MSNKCSKKTGAGPAPLTAFQTALWASYRLDPENTGHNAPLLLHWNCEIDIVRFEHAFSEVVRTTDSLRIVFEQTEGEVFQTTLDNVGYHMPWHDFSGHSDARRAAIAWISDIAAQPHDLATTPFRTALARLGDQSWIWLLDQHHILTDYSSKSLIISRLDHFYKFGQQDANPTVEYPSFVKLVPRIREDDDQAPLRMGGEASDIFGERIVTTTDQPDPEMLVHQFSLACPDSTSLKARKDVFDHLGAALVGLVASITSKSQFQVGVVINRRKRLQAAEYCGPILRTDSLRISLPENPTSAEIGQEWGRAFQKMKRNPGSPADQLHHDRVIFNFTLDPLADFN